MASVNFEFLRKRSEWQPLADLAGFAESYVHPDPVAAVVKLRSFGEQLVEFIYQKLETAQTIQA